MFGHNDATTPIAVGLVLWVVVSLILILLSRKDRAVAAATFADKFPPISDEEFVALCTPGTSPEVALKVRRIIADFLPVSYERVHPSMSFVEDIGAD